MILYINTTNNEFVEVALFSGDKKIDVLKKESKYHQSEYLLLTIDELLKKNNLSLKDLSGIKVENIAKKDTGFTSLRVGVVSANALAYALDVDLFDANNKKQEIVKAIYNAEPNIT